MSRQLSRGSAGDVAPAPVAKVKEAEPLRESFHRNLNPAKWRTPRPWGLVYRWNYTPSRTHTHYVYSRAKRLITWVLLNGESETPPCDTHPVSIGVRVTVHWQFSPKYEGSLTGQFNSKKKLPHLTTPRKMREQVGNPFPYRPRVWRWPLALPFQNPDLSRTQTSDHGRPDSMFAGCLSSETLPIVLLALPPLPPHFSSFHAPCLFGW